MALDGGFLHNLIKELSSTAVGTRVDKVHQPSRDEVVLTLRAPQFSKKLLLSARVGAARVNYTKKSPENPQTAPMFCMLLRKYISGATIVEITQPEFERVVIFKFKAYNELGDIIYPSIVLELISASPNIIFLDNDGVIVDSVRRSDIEKNVRLVASGAKYRLPQSQEKLSPSVTLDTLVSAIMQYPERKLTDVVMMTMDGVSPLIARELVYGCCGDIDSSVQSVTTKQLKWLVERLRQSVENGVPTLIKKPNGDSFEYSYMPLKQYGNDYIVEQMDSFSELLDDFYFARDNAERNRRAGQDLLKLLTNLSSRITRKITAQKNDLKRCENKEKYRIYGELLKANIYRIKKGESEAKVQNYYSETGEEITIPLNSALSPADNAQKYFKDYKKYCVAERTLAELIEKSEQELNYIESVFDALTRAENLQDIALIRDELASTGYIRRVEIKGRKPLKSTPLGYVTSDGFEVLAGKNNMQNDLLTTKLSDKRDLWFHTKGIHGSHVVLKLGGKDATDTAILEAAEIAAYNSKGKNSSGVAVDYTEVKNVKKPSGSKPGMVIYKTNNTVYVTPDGQKVNSLKKGGDQ